jgi:hypothetical protein
MDGEEFRGRALAPHPVLDAIEGPGLRPKRTRIIGLYTHPPDDATVICADELGPVIPRTWLEDHPRIHHAFIPVGACWLNLQEAWWRIFRKAALAGRSFANPDDIAQATTLATDQLNSRANPWIWGRAAPPTRRLRRRYVYTV